MNTVAEVAKFVGAFVGGSAVLLGALVWLLRVWFTHGLSRDLANHQAALDRTTEAESQRLRHELEITAADMVKRSTLLNEKRAKIIEELYAKLLEFISSAETYTAMAAMIGPQHSQAAQKELHAKSTDFNAYFRRHRIYFSESLSTGIAELYAAVYGPASNMKWLAREYENPIVEGIAALSEGEWDSAFATITERGPPLLAKIEKEFRALLGVKDVA